jgi:hypothetical protein
MQSRSAVAVRRIASWFHEIGRLLARPYDDRGRITYRRCCTSDVPDRRGARRAHIGERSLVDDVAKLALTVLYHRDRRVSYAAMSGIEGTSGSTRPIAEVPAPRRNLSDRKIRFDVP